jgi:hypothetical protein
MAFEPLTFTRHGGSSLTIDKFRRLSISSAARKELKLTAHQYVVFSVDVENKRIGVVRQELAKVPNATAVNLDKRGYFGTKAGKEICAKLALTDDVLPAKFSYIGFIDENGVRWSGFELVKPAE